MAEAQWARLQADVKCCLRRGAWYRVIRLGAREAVLDVGRTPLTVARSVLHATQQSDGETSGTMKMTAA